MSKKHWVLIVIAVSIGSYIVGSNWNILFTPKGLTVKEKQRVEAIKDSLSKKEIFKENDWTPFVAVKDTLNVIKVTYQEKYGMEKCIYCTAVFENRITGEYKCVASWLSNFVLQKCNLISFDPKIVPKKEME